MRSLDDLRRTLARIDGRGYKAYRDLEGAYTFDGTALFVDHVQGDPFATPSKLRLRIGQDLAELPSELSATRPRRLALEDFLARRVRDAIQGGVRGSRGSGRSGQVAIDAGGQEVLERTALRVTPGFVEARLSVGLPAAGRRVLGREAEAILCRELPEVAARALRWRSLPQAEARAFVACVENQEDLREQLEAAGLVAFVADGSVLPRASGVDDRPLRGDGVVDFRSPESLRVSLRLRNSRPGLSDEPGCIRGLGVPQGVTLIVGGGYHGKSTLLRGLERGVYPHVPGDGREYVVTTAGAVKVRAEDGRSVRGVDISPFIDELPHGRSTRAFASDDASGSTSQAASIVEAVEAGATALLLDEDTSATNFMVRDARMQELVAREHEPITPFVDRVRELHERLGVSTVLVMGGSGDYLDVADTVIALRDYVPLDAGADAKRIAASVPTRRRSETRGRLGAPPPRVPLPASFDASRGRREVKIDVRSRDSVVFGAHTLELRGVEQLVDPSQTRAAGYALHLAARRFLDGRCTLGEALDALDALLDAEGLDVLDPHRRGEEHPGSFARPRRHEIAAALNRLRSLRVR